VVLEQQKADFRTTTVNIVDQQKQFCTNSNDDRLLAIPIKIWLKQSQATYRMQYSEQVRRRIDPLACA